MGNHQLRAKIHISNKRQLSSPSGSGFNVCRIYISQHLEQWRKRRDPNYYRAILEMWRESASGGMGVGM